MNLSVDLLIRRAFALYKTHWRHLVPVAGAVYLVVTLVTALLLRVVGVSGALPSLALLVAGFYLVQGPATVAVIDVLDGRADMSVGDTIVKGFAHWRTLVPAALLAGALVAVGVLLIIPMLILLTIWIAVGSVGAIEDHGVMGTLGRSRELVRGHGWQVFLVILAVLVIGFVVGLVLSILMGILGLPTGLAQLITQLVTLVAVVPFTAIVWVLAYLGLREIRGEEPLNSPLPPSPETGDGFSPPV